MLANYTFSFKAFTFGKSDVVKKYKPFEIYLLYGNLNVQKFSHCIKYNLIVHSSLFHGCFITVFSNYH